MIRYWVIYSISEKLTLVARVEGEQSDEDQFRSELIIDKVKVIIDNRKDKSVGLENIVGSTIGLRMLYTSKKLIKDLFEKIYK